MSDYLCPFRIQRIKGGSNSPYEFTDVFRFCMDDGCPCYRKEGEQEWCYREYVSHPLNDKARESMAHD